MIEIVFDSAPNDIFLGAVRPVFCFEQNSDETWETYKKTARFFVERFSKEAIVVVRVANGVSINKMATALFVESCLRENKIDCVVFKVKDHQKALENYKPFVALGIAIKYALRLCSEKPERIYQSFGELGYLGLSFKKDYLACETELSLLNGGENERFEAHCLEEAISFVAMLKALSLAKIRVNARVRIFEKNTDQINPEKIVDRLISLTSKWIK